MKFQHLILPALLWGMIIFIAIFFPPTSLIVILGMILLIGTALYLTLNVFFKTHLPIISSGCIVLFLLSTVPAGFNFINLLLIGAIGVLMYVLSTYH